MNTPDNFSYELIGIPIVYNYTKVSASNINTAEWCSRSLPKSTNTPLKTLHRFIHKRMRHKLVKMAIAGLADHSTAKANNFYKPNIQPPW